MNGKSAMIREYQSQQEFIEALKVTISKQRKEIIVLDISFHNIQPREWAGYHRLKGENRMLQAKIDNANKGDKMNSIGCFFLIGAAIVCGTKGHPALCILLGIIAAADMIARAIREKQDES